MENGVEALNIAGNVLIFVLAITITISCFSSAMQSLNAIFEMRDADKYATVTDAAGNEYFLNFVRFDGGTRKVGIETIIPSIYRAYKENYAIYFYESSGEPMVLYETIIDGEMIEVNYIDLERELYANPEKAIEKINERLYKDGLYEDLKEKAFIEKLGEYYMNDLQGATDTAEVNKTKKRVITYTHTTT